MRALEAAVRAVSAAENKAEIRSKTVMMRTRISGSGMVKKNRRGQKIAPIGSVPKYKRILNAPKLI
jgi:hypothetical protein